MLPYRIILEENRAPLILDKEEDADDTDDHGAGDADHNKQPTVHLGFIISNCREHVKNTMKSKLYLIIISFLFVCSGW